MGLALLAGSGRWQGKLLGAAHWVSQLLVVLLLLLVSGAVFFFGSRLVAEPFIDALSEGAEIAVGVHEPGPRFSVGRLFKDLGHVLIDILIDVPLFFACHGVNLVIGFIPVVGPPVQLLCGWLINVVFSAMEMSAVGMARRGIRGWGRWQVAKANRTRILSLGAGVVMLMLLPLAQLLTLPVAVVAGTLVVIELERDDRLRLPERPAPAAEPAA
ncbi:MAG: EI24 domain-containing protein [Gammaproteobacteria bacterium]|nr:EI24 domain-containing protein [Gammaproteobacteria bacterium]